MSPTTSDLALALSRWTELSLLVKATLLLVTGLAAVAFAGRARASVRHLILAATFAAIAATPLLMLAIPQTTIEIPIATESAGVEPQVHGPRSPVPGAEQSPEVRVPRSRTGDWGPGTGDPSAIPWRSLLLTVWLIGTLLFAMPFLIMLWHLRSLRRTGLPSASLSDAVESLAREKGWPRHIEVLQHEIVASPITFGVWRPAILMPVAAAEWSDADLRRVLTHEVEHIRRADWLIHVMARVAAAAYWFHPLAWVAWRKLVLEAERACDDAVVEREERTDYAEQLVALAQGMKDAAPALGMAHRSDLSARVSALLDEARPRGRAGIRIAAVTIIGAAVMVVALAPLRAVAIAPNAVLDQNLARTELAISVPATFARFGRVVVGDQDMPMDTLLERLRRRQPSRVLIEGDGRVALRDLTMVMDLIKQAGVAQVAIAEQPRVPRRVRALDRELVEAAGNGDLEDVKDLIDAGANIDARVDGDGSPLIAAAKGHHLAVVNELLTRGADVNLAVPGDGNPLIAAAAAGAGDVVNLLLSHGAAIDLMVPGDENALIQAAGEGHLAIVQLLVSRGADVNARVWADRSGMARGAEGEWRTPLSQARRGRHALVEAFLLQSGARE
jgi:beta-lactamase regulating signal transducer with metallopeptidase domain